MKIERHDTGPRMSKAVVHGDTVYLAGIVADAPKGKSMGEQTKSILSQMNAVWDAWVSPGNTPARATVEAKLASPDYVVEIMVVAAR
jgi:enamine deaminase RidA (YjgF/YER057c/UK114 family)